MQDHQWADDPSAKSPGAFPAAPPGVRLYGISQIAWSTFLFGPLAGGWFMSRNFKVFGEEGAAFRTALTGFIGALATVAAAIFLPENFPGKLIPLFYLTVVSALAAKLQKERLEALKATGIPQASGGRVFLVGFLCLVITLVSAFAVFIAIDSAFPGLLPDDEHPEVHGPASAGSGQPGK